MLPTHGAQCRLQSTELALFTGACRSGKSAMAQAWVEARSASCIYLASARIGDTEMAERVALHQASRGGAWTTLELSHAPDCHNLLSAFQQARALGEAAVFDCTTLWMLACIEAGHSDATILEHMKQALAALPSLKLHLALVHNELGWGIVPESAFVRRFRDLSGHLGQIIAAAADSVTLAVCGLPVKIK